MQIIDNLSNENGRMVPDMITEKIASMSCKAAVKGNNKMSTQEANALIDQLLSLENPYNCLMEDLQLYQWVIMNWTKNSRELL